tara:strand:- start:227 stop:904 length:678 start_codon:yes stop_codon:yes gene_type:complete
MAQVDFSPLLARTLAKELKEAEAGYSIGHSLGQKGWYPGKYAAEGIGAAGKGLGLLGQYLQKAPGGLKKGYEAIGNIPGKMKRAYQLSPYQFKNPWAKPEIDFGATIHRDYLDKQNKEATDKMMSDFLQSNKPAPLPIVDYEQDWRGMGRDIDRKIRAGEREEKARKEEYEAQKRNMRPMVPYQLPANIGPIGPAGPEPLSTWEQAFANFGPAMNNLYKAFGFGD